MGDAERSWKRSWMPASSARASIWQLHMTKYHDLLCQDMGVDHRRKGSNVLAEVFAPYSAEDFVGCTGYVEFAKAQVRTGQANCSARSPVREITRKCGRPTGRRKFKIFGSGCRVFFVQESM